MTEPIGWLIRNLMTGEMHLLSNWEAATLAALAINGLGEGRPAFQLYSLRMGEIAQYEGRLSRPFGGDFDPLNPWDKEAA